MLDIIDSFKLLKGFPLAKYFIVKSEEDLEKLSFPYYLKANISGHKTEQKAVLRCNNLQEAQINFDSLSQFKTDIIAQETIEGIEIILGIKEDKVFGKLFMLGFGGIFAETIKDISFRALPIEKKEIEAMIKELKLHPILSSRKKYAINKLIDLADKISKMDISEADFNPIILTEKDAIIVDSRIEI